MMAGRNPPDDAGAPADGPAALLKGRLAAAMPVASIAFPLAGLALLALLAVVPGFLQLAAWLATAATVVAAILLLGSVFAALRHAETVAERVGEPFGTLILTLSVTVIEVTIVASMMLHGDNNPTLAREAVFSVLMIVCGGLVGACLLLGGMRHREQEFQPQATSAFLAVLIALSVLTMVMPSFSRSSGAATFSPAQLAFVSVASVLLYASFLFIQTVRHRGDFLDVATGGRAAGHRHGVPPARLVAAAAVLLIGSLAVVVLLAKRVAGALEEAIAALDLARPDAVVGSLIALMVLLPEGLNALRAAARNAVQTSLNAALGSALATIGLTIPAVAVVSLLSGRELVIGLDPADTVLLLLTLALATVTLGTGRTNMLTGLVHLVVFAAYVLFLVAP